MLPGTLSGVDFNSAAWSSFSHLVAAAAPGRGSSLRTASSLTSPSTPLPAMAPAGGGGVAVGGGSGLFFFGLAALLALAFLFVPRVLWAVRATALPAAPQPFLPTLERPG